MTPRRHPRPTSPAGRALHNWRTGLSRPPQPPGVPMLDGVFDSLTRLPPLARFAVALIVFLLVPVLCRRVRLPAVVGLLAAGVVFGPSGLRVVPKDNQTAHFFADIGKLLLMFFAGL